MISLDDPKWKQLEGGYRLPYDPRPALRRLQRGEDEAWNELWNELHHQGDVGTASYAAVPCLVELQEQTAQLDGNCYALLSTIEVQRHASGNPPLPDWLQQPYHEAWHRLRGVAARDVQRSEDGPVLATILSVLALAAGQSQLGALLLDMDACEIDALLEEHRSCSQVHKPDDA
jgi:hypothetical protein